MGIGDVQKQWANKTTERTEKPAPRFVNVRKVVLATALGVVALGFLVFGAVMIFVGIYATWAYQDDPSSAQNVILVPFGLVIGAPGLFAAYLAYRVARRDRGE